MEQYTIYGPLYLTLRTFFPFKSQFNKWNLFFLAINYVYDSLFVYFYYRYTVLGSLKFSQYNIIVTSFLYDYVNNSLYYRSYNILTTSAQINRFIIGTPIDTLQPLLKTPIQLSIYASVLRRILGPILLNKARFQDRRLLYLIEFGARRIFLPILFTNYY